MKRELKKDVRSLIRIAEAIDRETERFNRNFKETTSFGKTRKLVIGLKKLLKEMDVHQQISGAKEEVKKEVRFMPRSPLIIVSEKMKLRSEQMRNKRNGVKK